MNSGADGVNRTAYTGFTVNYSAKGKLSYFDQARKDIIEKPFENKDESETFAIPLERWGSMRNQQREQVRETYRVPSPLTIEEVKKDALLVTHLENMRGEKVTVILTSAAINQFETDAVVNAANETLLGGGGCDFEIHQGAGPLLVRECAHLNGCDVGQAVLTKGYDLPANYVIHTVGPLLIGGEKPDRQNLAKCYRACLEICEANHFQSVAFPCVACGFYAFPIDVAAEVVTETVKMYLERFSSHVKTIIFSVPKDSQQTAYLKFLG